MKNKLLIQFLKLAAFSGNILFMLWVTYNGINEGFRGTIYQKLSYIGLMGLLTINSYLILSRKEGMQKSTEKHSD